MPFHHPNDVFSFAAGEDMIDVFHKIQSVGASVLALAVPPEPHRSPLFCSLLVLVECDEMGEAGGLELVEVVGQPVHLHHCLTILTGEREGPVPS